MKIVLITKNEAHELEKFGYTFDKFGGMLHHSYSKHPKYYLRNLEKIRSSSKDEINRKGGSIIGI